LNEAQRFEDGDDLAASGPEFFPCSGNGHGLRPDELALQLWLTVFEEHFNYFFEIRIQFIQGFSLTVSPREAGHVAYITSVR